MVDLNTDDIVKAISGAELTQALGDKSYENKYVDYNIRYVRKKLSTLKFRTAVLRSRGSYPRSLNGAVMDKLADYVGRKSNFQKILPDVVKKLNTADRLSEANKMAKEILDNKLYNELTEFTEAQSPEIMESGEFTFYYLGGTTNQSTLVDADGDLTEAGSNWLEQGSRVRMTGEDLSKIFNNTTPEFPETGTVETPSGTALTPLRTTSNDNDLNWMKKMVSKLSNATKRLKNISTIDLIQEIGRYGVGMNAFIGDNRYASKPMRTSTDNKQLVSDQEDIGTASIDPDPTQEEVTASEERGEASLIDSLMSKIFSSYTFPCLLGIIPVHHVQTYEIARSGMLVKFRATGSVFLAQQDGGEDAITIESFLLPDELHYLILYWGLFLWCRGEMREAVFAGSSVTIEEIRAKIKDIAIENENYVKPTYEYHRTFPFVCKEFIIPNCYVETISLEDTVDSGKDVLKLSIMLRTYRKPTTIIYHRSTGGNIFFGQKVDQSVKMYKAIEYFANVLWRYMGANGYFLEGDSSIFNEQSWKKGSRDGIDSDDVYYDINVEDVANTVALGLVGML